MMTFQGSKRVELHGIFLVVLTIYIIIWEVNIECWSDTDHMH